jgi:hypothetical protein
LGKATKIFQQYSFSSWHDILKKFVKDLTKISNIVFSYFDKFGTFFHQSRNMATMCNRVAQIFLWPNIPKREKYTEGPQTTPNGHTLHIPNGHKLGVPNGRKIYQYFPCQGPPNIYIPKLGYKPSGSLAIQGRWG